MRKARFAGVAALIGLSIVGAVAYHRYGPSSLLSNEVASDRGGKRKGGSGQPVPVITAQAEAEDFKIRRRTIGIMESPAIVVVRARIDSQVLEQHVLDGQLVRKGDLLFTLDDREIQALIARDQAQLAKDNAALAQAQGELGRKQELIEKKVGTRAAARPGRRRLQGGPADGGGGRGGAAGRSPAARLREARSAHHRSPRCNTGHAGEPCRRQRHRGLVTITQIKPIRAGFTLRSAISQPCARCLRSSPPAEVRVYAPGEDKPLATGPLDFVDSSVDFSSGTIAAKAKFANDKLSCGRACMSMSRSISTSGPNTIIMPAVAIQSGQNGPFVFVAKNDQTVEMRNVELAGGEGNRLAIAKGVQAGERVVVEGQMRLTNGARVHEAAPESAAAAKHKDTNNAPDGGAQR